MVTKWSMALAALVTATCSALVGCGPTDSSETDQILPIMFDVRGLWSDIEVVFNECAELLNVAEEEYQERSTTYDLAQEYYLESPTAENKSRFDEAVRELTDAANRFDDVGSAYNRVTFASAKVMFLSNDITYALNTSRLSPDTANALSVSELEAKYTLTKSIVSSLSCQ